MYGLGDVDDGVRWTLKVAVFGATGSIGSLVARCAVQRGHATVAVSRSRPGPGQLEGCESRVGDMTNPGFAAEAIRGCDAVITCIGHRKKSANLWSASLSPPDIMASVTAAVVGAIGEDASTHLVYLGAFGVGSDLKKHSMLFRMVLRTSSIGNAYKDHANAEAIMKSSRASWTIVRSVGLTNADKDVDLVDRGGQWTSFDTVSRTSLARFLVECAESRATIHKTITVGERKP